MKKSPFSFIRIAVSAALIVILLYIMRNEYSRIVSVLRGTDMRLFCLAIGSYSVAINLASLRLKLIIEAQGDIPATFFECLELSYIGYFFNNFLPTAIGGDVVKAYHLSKKTKEKMQCYTAVLVDRAVGLFTMIFMGLIALFFVNNNILERPVKVMIFSIALASVLALIFVLNRGVARKFSVVLNLFKPVRERLVRAYNTVHRYKHYRMTMAQSLAVSVASQIFFFATIGILVIGIGSRIGVMDLLLRVPIICAMSLLPSINGLGVREGSTVLLLGPLIGKENAFAVSIESLAVLMVTSIVGGAIYALSPRFKMNLKEISQ